MNGPEASVLDRVKVPIITTLRRPSVGSQIMDLRAHEVFTRPALKTLPQTPGTAEVCMGLRNAHRVIKAMAMVRDEGLFSSTNTSGKIVRQVRIADTDYLLEGELIRRERENTIGAIVLVVVGTKGLIGSVNARYTPEGAIKDINPRDEKNTPMDSQRLIAFGKLLSKIADAAKLPPTYGFHHKYRE